MRKMRYIDDISNFIFVEDELQKADIIFIPGGSYAEIAEKAAELWSDGYAPFILPSGKYGKLRGYFPGPISKSQVYNKKYETEWEFLKAVLIINGVDEKAVLKEDRATFTYENALFSKSVTDDLHMDIKRAIICCKSFHARRCLMYYEMVYPNTEFVMCPSDIRGISKENWFKSEDGINKVLAEVERCGSQFREMLKKEI